jgi:hypothetical protein
MERQTGLSGDDDDGVSLAAGNEPVAVHSKDRMDRTLFFCCIFALKFCNQLTTSLLELPLARLAEDVICKGLGSGDTGKSEEDCKIPLVQNHTALIIGYKHTFDALACRSRVPVVSNIPR